MATVCCDLAVALLRDTTVVEGERISDIVLPAVLQLEPHLRERLLEVARGRLADDQVRAIVTHRPQPPDWNEGLDEEDRGEEREEDWDQDEDTAITSLCIPTHPAPARLLKTLDISVLTSVNLAYCRIPDLGRVVLPSGLRVLGLRGVYSGLARYTSVGTSGDSGGAGQTQRNQEDVLWASQGLTVLGKRLILLKVSQPPAQLRPSELTPDPRPVVLIPHGAEPRTCAQGVLPLSPALRLAWRRAAGQPDTGRRRRPLP